MKRKRAAVIRGGEWDTTQAVPRAAETLRSLGFQVSILCWDMTAEKPAEEVVGDGYKVRRFRRYIPPRSIRYFLAWPVWWAWVLWHLIRGRYALVHMMNVETLPPTVLGKWLLGYRLIYDIRDALGMALSNVRYPVPQFFTMMDRVLAPMADGILLSQGDVGICAKFFGRRATRKVPVVQVLNVPQYDPPLTYRTPSGSPLRINFSGFISSGRGALQISEALHGQGDVVVDVVGEIRQEFVRDRFVAMGNAVLHGRVPYEDALELMDRSDLVCLLYDNALMTTAVCSSNKMFEAMSLGKPYLATKGGWPDKVAECFGLGWSIPYGDAGAMRRLIERLIANPSLLVEAGRCGREAYEKHFVWPRQRENMVRLYRRVLNEDGAGEERLYAGWKRFIGTCVELEHVSNDRRRD